MDVLPEHGGDQEVHGRAAGEEFRVDPRRPGQEGTAGASGRFLRASGLWSVQLYKEEIEIMLRTPGHGGFQLLDLHDFPGQGTALIGVLDPFWDSKGLITPEAFRSFLRADGAAGAIAQADLYGRRDVFGPDRRGPLWSGRSANAKAAWTIKDSQGREVAAGLFAPKPLPTGELTTVGQIETSLAKAAPRPD